MALSYKEQKAKLREAERRIAEMEGRPPGAVSEPGDDGEFSSPSEVKLLTEGTIYAVGSNYTNKTIGNRRLTITAIRVYDGNRMEFDLAEFADGKVKVGGETGTVVFWNAAIECYQPGNRPPAPPILRRGPILAARHRELAAKARAEIAADPQNQPLAPEANTVAPLPPDNVPVQGAPSIPDELEVPPPSAGVPMMPTGVEP